MSGTFSTVESVLMCTKTLHNRVFPHMYVIFEMPVKVIGSMFNEAEGDSGGMERYGQCNKGILKCRIADGTEIPARLKERK